MVVNITYITSKTKMKRSKGFIVSSVAEALKMFNWRYGHTIVDISY